MFGHRKTENQESVLLREEVAYLLLQSEKIFKSSLTNNLEISLSSKGGSPELEKTIENLNCAFQNYASSVNYNLMKYQMANQAFQLGLWDMDVVSGDPVNPDNSFTWSNEFRQMLGFSNEHEFPNKLSSWSDRLHPDDKQAALDAFANHMTDYTGRTPYSVEYRLQMKNGEYRYFYATGATQRNAKGAPIRVAGLLRDIHELRLQKEARQKFTGYELLLDELKQMQSEIIKNDNMTVRGGTSHLSDELKEVMDLINQILDYESERNSYQLTKFQLINNASKIGLWDMDVVKGDPVNPLNTFRWSDEFRHLLGYSNETEFPNVLSSWSEKLHPEDKEITLDKFAKHLLDKTGRTPYDLEYRLLKKNGEYGYFHAYGSTIRDNAGHAQRVAGAIEDISVQMQNKTDLDMFSLRLELLQKSINIALWDMVVDPNDPVSGDNDFWWSDEFRRLLGYTSESDFPNRLDSWSGALHPEDKDKTLNAFAAHLMDKTGRTPYNVEYRVRKKSGEYIWLKADGSTLRNTDGTPVRVVGSVEDISNRLRKHELEDNIEQFSQAIANMAESIDEVLRVTQEITAAQEKNLEASRLSEKNALESKSIVTSVKNVAEQTNILGINASIEAARSGEHGRGFKVVSDEIIRLANESKKSTETIETKLKTIQDSTGSMTNDIKNTVTLVNNQYEVVDNVRSLADKINTMYTALIDELNKQLL